MMIKHLLCNVITTNNSCSLKSELLNRNLVSDGIPFRARVPQTAFPFFGMSFMVLFIFIAKWQCWFMHIWFAEWIIMERYESRCNQVCLRSWNFGKLLFFFKVFIYLWSSELTNIYNIMRLALFCSRGRELSTNPSIYELFKKWSMNT